MKFEVEFRGRIYRVELPKEVKSASGKPFSIAIQVSEGEKTRSVRILDRNENRWTLEIDGRIHDIIVTGPRQNPMVHYQTHTFPLTVYDLKDRLSKSALPETAGKVSISAPMPGRIVSVLASEGQDVTAGQGLVVIEAMKMQNELQSPKSGRVTRANAREGDRVNAGEVLFEVE